MDNTGQKHYMQKENYLGCNGTYLNLGPWEWQRTGFANWDGVNDSPEDTATPLTVGMKTFDLGISLIFTPSV